MIRSSWTKSPALEKLGTLPGFGNTLLIMHANGAQNWAASLVFGGGRKLRAHARHRIAPIAVASGAADGPHLEHVCRSRGEALDRHRPRAGEHAGALPGTGSVPLADSREPHFVAPRMRNGRDFQYQLGAVAEANVEN